MLNLFELMNQQQYIIIIIALFRFPRVLPNVLFPPQEPAHDTALHHLSGFLTIILAVAGSQPLLSVTLLVSLRGTGEAVCTKSLYPECHNDTVLQGLERITGPTCIIFVSPDSIWNIQTQCDLL